MDRPNIIFIMAELTAELTRLQKEVGDTPFEAVS